MKSEKLDVKKVLDELRNSENSSNRRKGTFKIEAPFDEAVKSILKVKPTHSKSTKR